VKGEGGRVKEKERSDYEKRGGRREGKGM